MATPTATKKVGAPMSEADKAKKNAERAAKLKELAPPRVQRATTALKAIGKLGNYKPTATQADAIIAALKKQYDNAVSALKGSTPTPDFELPSA